MMTAVDTNVLSAIWTKEVNAAELAVKLAEARRQGLVLICGAVFAETLASPSLTEDRIRAFLQDTGIQVDAAMNEGIWCETGRRYARYVNRKRKSSADAPKRLLADFIIGAHALTQADRLMTLDKGRYKTDFPELVLM